MSSDKPTCHALREKVPAGWDVCLLPDVTEFQEGPGILAKDFCEAGVPLLRLRNIETPTVQLKGCNFLAADRVAKKWAHFALRENDLLISTSASLGRVSAVTNVAVGSVAYTGIIRFRSSDPTRLDHGYLRAFLSSAAFVEQAEQMATGSVIRHFGPSHLKQMAIALPSLIEQRQIAEISDALDDRIALLRETNTTLEAIAQALFKSWFVDFDPVCAKQEGRTPDGMDETTAALFPDTFEVSGLGPIPTGWRVAKVEEVMELAYGKALKASDRIPGSVPVYGSGGVTGNHSEALVVFPSIIIGRKGTVGSLYWEDRPFFPIDTVFYVRTHKPLTYCFYQLACLGLEGMNTDGAVPGLNRNNVYRLQIVLPPDEVLSAFDSVAAVLRQKIRNGMEQINLVSALRDTLLPRLVSGKLRLPEVEAEPCSMEKAHAV